MQETIPTNKNNSNYNAGSTHKSSEKKKRRGDEKVEEDDDLFGVEERK
jgi:hypothetical protein